MDRHRHKLPKGDRLVKESEYDLKYKGAHPTDDVYRQVNVPLNKWEKTKLPVEKNTTFKNDYKSPKAPGDVRGQAKEAVEFMRNRNGNILRPDPVPTRGNTNYRDEYIKREGGADQGFSPYEGLQGVHRPRGYKSPWDGKTSYKKDYVDYHVQICECPYVPNPNAPKKDGARSTASQ